METPENGLDQPLPRIANEGHPVLSSLVMAGITNRSQYSLPLNTPKDISQIFQADSHQ